MCETDAKVKKSREEEKRKLLRAEKTRGSSVYKVPREIQRGVSFFFHFKRFLLLILIDTREFIHVLLHISKHHA